MRVPVLLAITGVLAWGGAPLAAKDEPTPAQALAERLQSMIAGKDRAGLTKTLPQLVTVHNACRSKNDRALLLKTAAQVLAHDGLGSARGVAADCLGRLNDEAGALRPLARHLPSTKDETVSALSLRVIAAMGYLAPDAGVAPLLNLVHKSADPNAATHAVRALGGFGYSKHRQKILLALLKRSKASAPGQSKSKKGVNSDAARMWRALNGEITSALNQLTGRRLPDIEAWHKLHKAHKKKLSKLFTRPR